MSNDTELEIWRQEWRDQTEPLPELRKKIKRQNLRTAAAIIAIGVCLAVSTSVALKASIAASSDCGRIDSERA